MALVTRSIIAWLLMAITLVSSAPYHGPANLAYVSGTDWLVAQAKPHNHLHEIPPGTDRGLYNKGLIEGDIVVDALRPPTKNAVTNGSMLWPYGVVVYKVEDDVGCPDSPQCDILMKAMDHYHRVSCIRFKEWSGEENYVSIFFNNERSGACWSSVGRLGNGEQRLSLGQRCWYNGIVIHELGHAIGFWHEMNRPDRDSWIYIYWNNITPGFSSAFAKYDYSKVDTLGETFDYKSIMMYDEYAFSKDGSSPTLMSVGGTEIGPIWKKSGLSESDQRRLNRLYQCEGNTPHVHYPYDISCHFDRNACGFKNAPTSDWQWRTINETSGYVHCSSKSRMGQPNKFVSPVIPGVQAGDHVRGPMGCVRFYYTLKSERRATLQLEQAYLSRTTTMKYNLGSVFPLWRATPSGNDWKHVELPIYVTSPFKLIFSAKFDGGDNEGSAALDVFEVFYKPCANPTPTEFSYAAAPPE